MASSSRRFLVLARAGGKSLHREWLGDGTTARTWDLQLNAYGDQANEVTGGDLPTVVDQGTKWDSLARHFRAHPELLDRYDYVMLPDDDLRMAPGDINRLFELATQQDLVVSQLAMSRDSWVTYPALMTCPGYQLRYTNHIDSMAPCIRSSYLKTLLPLIERHISGWGADHVWALLMEEPAYRCAVIDEVTMVHTRPLGSGTIHGAFARQGVDPVQEVRTVTGMFDNFPGSHINYAGRLLDGRRVGSLHVMLHNGFWLVIAAPFTKTPYKIFRKGIGMLLQTLTHAGHLPRQLRYVDESERQRLEDGPTAVPLSAVAVTAAPLPPAPVGSAGAAQLPA